MTDNGFGTLTQEQLNEWARLRVEVYDLLEEADFLATQLGDWDEEDIRDARELIPSLTSALHVLVIEHTHDAKGNCRVCPGEQSWPCPIVRSVHAAVKDPTAVYNRLMERQRDEAHYADLARGDLPVTPLDE
jgi:hypothetical protein